MKLKTFFKRKAVKAHRKVFGKTKEIMLTTGKGGLTKPEIEDVMGTLGKAMKQGKLPPLSYEYRPPTIMGRRAIVWLIPETVSVATARAKVKAVLKAEYGSKYIVN